MVDQFYLWFKFYFPFFLDIVMYDNEFETKEDKVENKDKIKPWHNYRYMCIIYMYNKSTTFLHGLHLIDHKMMS